MDGAGLDARSVAVLSVGDPRRERVGRAVLGTLLTAGSFVAFAYAVKEVRPLASHAPWQDDPYDTVVSFAIFLVPLAASLVGLRALPCRRGSALPLARIADVMRSCRVVLAAVSVTLVTDWLSVGLRADAGAWNVTTGLLVAALSLTTVMACWTTSTLRSAARDIPLLPTGDVGPDALADAITLAKGGSRRLGPLGPPARALLSWLERRAAPRVRRHPVGVAALFAACFGMAITSGAALEEGGGPVLALFFVVGTCGIYAFTIAAGAYLGVVRADRPLRGPRRSLALASVLAAAAIPLALAFRGMLWGSIGRTAADAGLDDLFVLVAVAGLAIFVGALVLAVVAQRPRGSRA